ncbi:hypothetical protein V5799_008340 [Amblyomma americanum]|uniref:Evasin n=1 Tax=Amblyomma americanum TaxID=6943 RepID=A0AAQ4FEC5_AMBAM
MDTSERLSRIHNKKKWQTPTVPVLTVNVPEEGCNHFLSPVRYMERVDSSCNMLCSNQQFKQVQEGTLCARQTTGKWPVVTRVGQCVADACREKAPDTPPVHEKVNANFDNCRILNELTVISGKLNVVLCCQVECAYGNFENRKDGVKCLVRTAP